MNNNIMKVKKSKIRELTNKINQMENSINLTLGQPDFKVSRDIKNALIKAINEDKTIYTDNYGIDELRKEISKYLNYKGINYKKEEITITAGSSEGLFSSIATLINKGDNILIPCISYPAYENIIKILGGEVITYNLDKNFKIDMEDLKFKLEDNKIKIIILSHPSNPTGSILELEEYKILSEILKDKDLYIITDEVYEAFSYKKNYSIAMNKYLINKIIYIGGFSKMFSATGLRVGFVAASNRITNEIIKTHQYNVSCVNSISQYGVLEGLKYNLYFVDLMKNEFVRRKDYCIDRLKKLDIEVVEPEGGFYIFASIKKINLSSEEFCTRLLEEYGVACVPGSSFGEGGEGYVRISFCYSLDHLIKAFELLGEFIMKLNKEDKFK